MDAATLFLRQLDETIAHSSEYVTNGGCKDYAEYSAVVGRIQGMKEAHSRFKALMDKVRKSGDDDIDE